ncbi:MAG: response regulator [Burkholderiales bacterium]
MNAAVTTLENDKPVSHDLAGAHLLVVDDEAVNLEIIGEYLAEEPYRLACAADGMRALELLGKEDFDCVILDRMMPRMDGMEVLRRMKSDARYRNIPVIMQTAAASREQVAEGLRLGAYYYLTKPYHQDALRSVVRSALGAVRALGNLQQRIGEYAGMLTLLQGGKFRLRTLTEARSLAAALAGACKDPPSAGMGLAELLVNAVEHGNLGIDFAQKSGLLEKGCWEDEVEARLALPEYRGKYVEVEVSRTGASLRVLITDQGQGFDWNKYLEFDESRALAPNGRGIALAKSLAFREMEYSERGNIVAVALEACGQC